MLAASALPPWAEFCSVVNPLLPAAARPGYPPPLLLTETVVSAAAAEEEAAAPAAAASGLCLLSPASSLVLDSLPDKSPPFFSSRKHRSR